jgi:hypothetical protein
MADEGKKILVVGDGGTNRELVRRVLQATPVEGNVLKAFEALSLTPEEVAAFPFPKIRQGNKYEPSGCPPKSKKKKGANG